MQRHSFVFHCFHLYRTMHRAMASAFIFYLDLDCISIHNTVNIAIVYRLLQRSLNGSTFQPEKKEEKSTLIGHCVRSYSDQQPQKMDNACENALHWFLLLSLMLCYCFIAIFCCAQRFKAIIIGWQVGRRKDYKIYRTRQAEERVQFAFSFNAFAYSVESFFFLIHSLFSFLFSFLLVFLRSMIKWTILYITLFNEHYSHCIMNLFRTFFSKAIHNNTSFKIFCNLMVK